ncbi:MAG: FkbM family methyltransferase, partial [Actinomycetota bacterium]|nr:FkbM family methyltransferase [Actinomycetota bacterium]
VRLVAAAATASVGTVPFVSSVGSDSGVRGSVTHHAGDDSYSVDATTLDALTTGLIPAVVKIDVEGGEVDVLAGAPRLLAARGSHWIVEVHSEPLREEVVRIFQTAGYRIEQIAPRRGDYGQDYVVAIPARADGLASAGDGAA